MAIALDWYDLDRRRDLNRLFAQDASLRETGRSLEGQFHTQDIFSGLDMFLTVSPRIFSVYSSSEATLFHGFGYGLIDLDSLSAALISDRSPEQVVVYGNDTAYDQLNELLDQWDQIGHPSILDLHISAFFSHPKFIPEGHWIIAKRSAYTWVLSWGT
jgi:hypothetical protein